MASIVLGAAGSAIGGPIGGFIGSAIGSVIDNMLFSDTQKLPDLVGPRMADLTVQVSTYGKVIPMIYGTMRIAGNVIDSQPIKETEHRETTSQGGGKGGGGKVSQTSITYTYSVTLVIAVCAGPVDEIIRVWADSKVLDGNTLTLDSGKYNVHLGTEDQLPDDIIGRYRTAGTYPAYRGIAYVVIEDLDLTDFGNRIPNFTFEVRRTVRFQPAVEDKITAVTFIPGAGEFVYETTNIEKTVGSEDENGGFIQTSGKVPLNRHNYEDKANVLVALDQLQDTLPNLEWVALVVTWFATSTDAGDCIIVPKIEFPAEGVQITPYDWQVGGVTRENAELVLQFDDDKPTYGGTPSDKSVIAICQELKSRGLKIMLYPMPFVDTITPVPKPWRGRIIPADATDANGWFTKSGGYNEFIRHYSQLSVGGVHINTLIDAFIIGSELVGMTSFTDTPGNYPAVNQLVSLAGAIRSDLGGSIKLTYAADWSEYHHADGGWFNMDALWASPNIDMVGIDAYFPLTPDLPQSQITAQKIYDGWTKDEGYDYFWDGTRTTKTNFIDYAYAWKNVEYWWSNTHTNPDSSPTDWTPQMKPIIFTEFGFPSVDGCANQPNVFYDPTSSESFFPRGSKGRIDYQAQRQALNATLDFLQDRNAQPGKSDLIPHAFVWTWDARPFPFWPDLLQVWQDGVLWKTGHWIEGKLGASTLGSIVANILDKTGLAAYDTSRLTDLVDGFVVTKQSTARQLIEQLQQAYFFDAVESEGIIKFVKRGGEPVVDTIAEEELVPLESGGIRATVEITRAQDLELPQKVNTVYINRVAGFQPSTQIAQRQTVNSVDSVTLNLPIVLGDQQAKTVADITLYNAWISRTSFKLTLPPKYAAVEPTDIIPVEVSGVVHHIRILQTTVAHGGLTQVEGVAEDVSTYDFYTPPGAPPANPGMGKILPETRLELMDLPPLPSDTEQQGIMRIATVGLGSGWNGAVLFRSDDGGESGGNTFTQVTTLTTPAIMGGVINNVPAGPTAIFDTATEIEVALVNGTLASVTELAVLNGANATLVGDEIIQFQNATLVSSGRYKLSRLLRGRLGTEHQVSNHTAGERFILLDGSIQKEAIPTNIIGQARHYKGVTIGATLGDSEEEEFTYSGNTLKPFSPVHITGTRDGSDNLTITWIRRTRVSGEWRDNVDVPLGEAAEKYEVDIYDGSTVVRTITGLTSATASYTAAEQTADFGSVQGSVEVAVYQLSAVVGRGHPEIGVV